MNTIWKGKVPGPFDNLSGNYHFSDKSLPFVSNDRLLELNIRHDYQRHLGFKAGLEQTLLQVTHSLGQSSFMSPSNFHSFVKMISNSVTLKAGGSVKSFVDAFIYRALAMIEPPEYVTVDAEYGLVGIGVPSEREETGICYKPACIVDYRIIVSKDPMDADELLEEGVSYMNMVQREQSILPLSVLEPEPGGVDLEQCISHLAWKMCATAKSLRKTTMRGALTDGFEWIFLILNMEPDGIGASYSCSYAFPPLDPRHIYTGGPYEDGNDIITGILASWIRRNCEPLSDKDWLEYVRRV